MLNENLNYCKANKPNFAIFTKILKKESMRSKSTLCHSKTYQRGFILTERRVAEKAKYYANW